MAKKSLTYTGDAGRYYPTLGLEPEVGETYQLAEDPDDGRWESAPAAAKTAKKRAARKAAPPPATQPTEPVMPPASQTPAPTEES